MGLGLAGGILGPAPPIKIEWLFVDITELAVRISKSLFCTKTRCCSGAGTTGMIVLAGFTDKFTAAPSHISGKGPAGTFVDAILVESSVVAEEDASRSDLIRNLGL